VAAIPAFSPQICAQALNEKTSLPLIRLLDGIAGEVERQRMSRVAIFGARVTIKTRPFGWLDRLADIVSPQPKEVDDISGIYGEIVEIDLHLWTSTFSYDRVATKRIGIQNYFSRRDRCWLSTDEGFTSATNPFGCFESRLHRRYLIG
jgi:hypothetical protein